MGIFIFLLNRISELTGLYFFSALLQADAAILGILGVFIIFRFQNLQSNISRIIELLIKRAAPDGQPGTNIYFISTINQFDVASLEIKEKYVNEKIFKKYNNFGEQWLVYEKEKIKIKDLIKLPIVLLGIGLILNMIFLSFAERLYYVGFQLNIIMGITILYHIFLFIKLIQLIFKAVPPMKGP